MKDYRPTTTYARTAVCAPALLSLAAVVVAAGGLAEAGAHSSGTFGGIIDVLDYDVIRHGDSDWVVMTLSIKNTDSYGTIHNLRLVTNDNFLYSHLPSSDGPDGISRDDCLLGEGLHYIEHNGIAQITACFEVKSGFGHHPSALHLQFNYKHHSHSFSGSNFLHGLQQVVPFHDESDYCFSTYADFCAENNIQDIDGIPAPAPEPPEPEPESATLLHVMYRDQTGVLTLVFDKLVVANNPGRIQLIHDVDAFIEDGDAPDLGDAALETVDGKRQSAILSFVLPDALRRTWPSRSGFTGIWPYR